MTGAANGKITVTVSTGFQVKMDLPSTLAVEKATKGSIADVTVGSRILQRGEQVSERRGNRALASGNNDASEIIVVPSGSKFKGLTVTAVTGDKISAAANKPGAVDVHGETDDCDLQACSLPGERIAKGAEILADGEGALGRETFDANAIIILAPGSAFAKQ